MLLQVQFSFAFKTSLETLDFLLYLLAVSVDFKYKKVDVILHHHKLLLAKYQTVTVPEFDAERFGSMLFSKNSLTIKLAENCSFL